MMDRKPESQTLKDEQVFYWIPSAVWNSQFLSYCKKDNRWEVYDSTQLAQFDNAVVKSFKALSEDILLDIGSFPPCTC